jgi:hypothetical protein
MLPTVDRFRGNRIDLPRLDGDREGTRDFQGHRVFHAIDQFLTGMHVLRDDERGGAFDPEDDRFLPCDVGQIGLQQEWPLQRWGLGAQDVDAEDTDGDTRAHSQGEHDPGAMPSKARHNSRYASAEIK